MIKSLIILLSLLTLVVIGIYFLSAPKRDFFKLYPYNDDYFQHYKEFKLRKTSEIIVDGIGWNYLSIGNGNKTILFLHGMGGSYDIWWQQILEFEKDFRIISYTLPESINTLEQSANGIKAILAKEKVEIFTAIGTSMGGYITQYLTTIMPERLDKVVFGNTFPPNDIIKQENLQKEKIIPWLPEVLLVKLADKKLENEIIPAAKDSELLKAFLPSIPFSKKQFINRYAVVIDTFTVNIGKSKQIPKLILESDNDPLVQKKLRDVIKKTYTDAKVYTFHEAGHFPYINEGKEYNTVLKTFLEE
jgi:pimeloyl-ACP methyl ester carboxylesterase